MEKPDINSCIARQYVDFPDPGGPMTICPKIPIPAKQNIARVKSQLQITWMTVQQCPLIFLPNFHYVIIAHRQRPFLNLVRDTSKVLSYPHANRCHIDNPLHWWAYSHMIYTHSEMCWSPPHTGLWPCGQTATRSPGLPFNGLHPCNPCNYMYY